jgi:hypothetical protein
LFCRAAAIVTGRAQPFGEQLTQQWPACWDVHDVDGRANFTYVPDEIFHRIRVGEVVVAVDDGCEYLGSVRIQ